MKPGDDVAIGDHVLCGFFIGLLVSSDPGISALQSLLQ